MLKVEIAISGNPFVLFLTLITTFVNKNVTVINNRVEMLDLLIIIVFLVE